MFKSLVVLCGLSLMAADKEVQPKGISTEERIELLVKYKAAADAYIKFQAESIKAFQAQIASQPISDAFNKRFAEIQAATCRLDETFACVSEDKAKK